MALNVKISHFLTKKGGGLSFLTVCITGNANLTAVSNRGGSGKKSQWIEDEIFGGGNSA
jgi:hypothetical protein